MRSYPFLIFLVLIFACSDNQKQNDSELKTATESKSDEPELKNIPRETTKSLTTSRYTIEDIQGIWGSFDSLENADFWVEGDSIFYLEGEAFPVEVHFDSMKISYDKETLAFKINWIRGDTMSYKSYGSDKLILRGPR